MTNFVSFPTSRRLIIVTSSSVMFPLCAYDGGLTVTWEMRTILNYLGPISAKQSGQKLRTLYEPLRRLSANTLCPSSLTLSQSVIARKPRL